ncbi:MAG: sulfatase [Kiritimatiellae bacterium]|nr:sulfatase [Kiritimatiellia bacterium]
MNNTNRREFLKQISLFCTGTTALDFSINGKIRQLTSGKPGKSNTERLPNIIFILCDNLGYGDLGCTGNTRHRTPNVDRLAREGMTLTSFYASSPVCTPSRASAMTGCYAQRVNLHVNDTGGLVLQPVSPKGLNPNEITIAEVLKTHDYATACIGKWHLGDQPEFLPTRQGFDHYFGIPYSDDMTEREGKSWPPLPLMRGEQVVEAPADRDTLTKRYTEDAIRFITENRNQPFFLYLPYAMPGSTRHPFASKAFKGKSVNGAYGDSVEELDWSLCEILATLQRLNLDDHTLIVWTSDNGTPNGPAPWGSNAPMGGWAYSTAEGGMRMPCFVRWPGKVPAGTKSDELMTMMDLLPTFAQLAGTQVPTDRIIDGRDISPLLLGQPGAKSPHKVFYYYFVDQLQAVRDEQWKLCLPLETKRPGTKKAAKKIEAALYNVKTDLGETRNVIGEYPDVVARLMKLAEQAREDLGDLNQPGKNSRPAGMVDNPRPQVLRAR